MPLIDRQRGVQPVAGAQGANRGPARSPGAQAASRCLGCPGAAPPGFVPRPLTGGATCIAGCDLQSGVTHCNSGPSHGAGPAHKTVTWTTKRGAARGAAYHILLTKLLVLRAA